ncbi:MAG: hypothetical protein AB1487_03770 [Thermodesulfobacteriota bacterium]
MRIALAQINLTTYPQQSQKTSVPTGSEDYNQGLWLRPEVSTCAQV